MLDTRLPKADMRLNGGWPSRIYNYFSWSYSCLLLKKQYDDVEIVTDEFGKSILIDKLQLPYSNVVVRLDELNKYDSLLWALGKVYCYSLQKEPFIHVDGDIFIYDKFRPDLENAGIVAQNIETEYEIEVSVEFSSIPDYLEGRLTPGKTTQQYNMGTFGGNDIDLIHQYTKEAFSFVEKNYIGILASPTGKINCIFEQVLLFHYLAEKKIPVSCIFDPHPNLPENTFFFNPGPIAENYIHLAGSLKEYLFYYKTLEIRLANEFPDVYQKILRLYAAMEI
ncbi:DUF6734 family protein [Puia dinghuensis]|uniref:DUF6734 domain-containing protein n=1 Tax=Puia dinghuensis TaxID=1792502 RepID=A0A8J2XPL7_9BACT|nr:DUF6734 family protein [Puia dinghuensis]GGA81131.1 hypothetical protein GCM10011511_00120 [Puia dinghuensis]